MSCLDAHQSTGSGRSPSLTPEMAMKLQKDLANFDQIYLSIKQDGRNHEKIKSISEVDAKLEEMLKRYGLEETIHAFKKATSCC